MSHKNKEIVKRVNTAFTENKPEDFLALCSEDVKWTMVGTEHKHGKTKIREWMKGMEGMDPPKFTVDQMIAEGDSVVCYGDMTMKNEAGVEGKYSYCDVYHFDGDEIDELRSFIVHHKTDSESSDKASV